MGDYASKGVAGTGLGLGIAGLSVAMLNGGCGGILGNLFGNNRCGYGMGLGLGESQYVASILAENGMLKAENYADRVAKEVYQQTLADNEKLMAQMEKTVQLREENMMCRVENLANTTTCRFNSVDTAIASLANTVNGITKCVIPTTAICPEVMPRYNSWTAPTAAAPTQQAVTGSVNVS